MAEYKYAFDLFGTSTANKLIDEEHEFIVTDVHVVTSIHGLFYASSVVLVDEATGAALALGTDYLLTGYDHNVTAETGKTAIAGLALVNTTFVGKLKLTCQLVGGPQGQASEAANNLAAAIKSAVDNPTVNWTNITNRPAYFPPALHKHRLAHAEDLDVLTDTFRELITSIRDRRPYHDSVHNITEQQDRTLQLIAQMRKAINSIVTVTGSAEQILEIQESVKKLHEVPNVSEVAFAGISKTIGEWDVGSVSRVSAIVTYKSDSDKVHSLQVDLCHDGTDTLYSMTGELRTGDPLFSIAVQESVGVIRLNVVPKENGNFKVKYLCAI